MDLKRIFLVAVVLSVACIGNVEATMNTSRVLGKTDGESTGAVLDSQGRQLVAKFKIPGNEGEWY